MRVELGLSTNLVVKCSPCDELSSVSSCALSERLLTLRVDDHLLKSPHFALLLPHLGNLAHILDVRSVRARSKDTSTEARSSLVRTRHERSAGVVDEGRAVHVDVATVESFLEELDDVLSDGIFAFESLQSAR